MLRQTFPRPLDRSQCDSQQCSGVNPASQPTLQGDSHGDLAPLVAVAALDPGRRVRRRERRCLERCPHVLLDNPRHSPRPRPAIHARPYACPGATPAAIPAAAAIPLPSQLRCLDRRHVLRDEILGIPQQRGGNVYEICRRAGVRRRQQQ